MSTPAVLARISRRRRTAFGVALLLAIAIGLSIGFTLGLNRFASEVFEPMLVALYSIPKITLYPILLLMFGLGIVGEDRLRHHPRRHPDRAVHDQRGAQRPPGLHQDRTASWAWARST